MVVHAYYPHTETRVQRQAEALVDAGYEVDVICLREPGEPATETYRGVRVHRLGVQLAKRNLAEQFGSYLRFLVLAAIRLARLDRDRRYDTVQVHNLPDFLVLGAIGPKLRGVPVILDLHDLMPEFFAGRFGPRRHRLMERLIRWQERCSCRFADHIVTVSGHWREALISRGVAPSECSVVMNVADERIFTRRTRAPRAAPDATFELIYHGTVTERYGLDLAVRAVASLRDELPEIHLTVLGRGDHMPELVDLCKELDIGPHVTLRDEYLTAEHLPEVLERADLGVVPYRDDVFTDGLLPTKLMEYAVMGIPCVASRTTAIERYFEDTMVELFEPGDPDDLARRIRALARDPTRREALARRSAEFTRRYNWKEIGGQYVALVQRLGRGS